MDKWILMPKLVENGSDTNSLHHNNANMTHNWLSMWVKGVDLT